MRISINVFLTFSLLIFPSCELDLFEKYEPCEPVIEISEIIPSSSGVQINGRIIDKGVSDIEFIRVTIGLEGPSYVNNQIPVAFSENNFQTFVSGLETDTSYYFMAFASNDCGIRYSEAKKFYIPISEPPTVPCTVPENQVYYNNVYQTMSSVQSGNIAGVNMQGSFGLLGSNQTGNLKVLADFYSVPANGIYTTVDNTGSSLAPGKVILRIQGSGTWRQVESGGNVYVENIDDQEFQVSFCDLSYSVLGTNYEFKGNLHEF